MNVVEFFSRPKGMEKGTEIKKIGEGHWMSDAEISGNIVDEMLRE